MTDCHVCGSANAEPLVQKTKPYRLVSSDVRPASGAAEFLLCSNCLAVQKATTPAWQAMTEVIYATYDINHQSMGVEPTIFDSAKGTGPRSLMLLRNLLDVVELPQNGRLLDFGCSNGNLLKSFHGLRPDWRLSGAELVDQWRETVLALPGVEAFYSGQAPAYDGKFDVISLSHVLEHIPDPSSFLRTISGYLTDGGRILLATPNIRQNSVDLVIADHCTHFDDDSLRFVADAAGLNVELLSVTMLPKELVTVLSKGGGAAVRTGGEQLSADQRRARSRERCLFYFSLLEEGRALIHTLRAGPKPFGVMGSSIAALWTLLELDGKVDFFVDEDKNRIGHELEGKPIVSPEQIPPGTLVFIPLSVPIAEKIIQRWKHLPVDFRFIPSNRPI